MGLSVETHEQIIDGLLSRRNTITGLDYSSIRSDLVSLRNALKPGQLIDPIVDKIIEYEKKYNAPKTKNEFNPNTVKNVMGENPYKVLSNNEYAQILSDTPADERKAWQPLADVHITSLDKGGMVYVLGK